MLLFVLKGNPVLKGTIDMEAAPSGVGEHVVPNYIGDFGIIALVLSVFFMVLYTHLHPVSAVRWQYRLFAMRNYFRRFFMQTPKFKLGDKVHKIKGSRWRGTVVGMYSTSLTPEGYCVESDTETGSVQIYPAAALELNANESEPGGKTD